MWARVWLTLAAVETEQLALRKDERPGCSWRWSRVNECNSGPPRKIEDVPKYPDETVEMVKLVSQERVASSSYSQVAGSI